MQISLLQLFEHLQLTIEQDRQQYVYSYLLNGSFGVVTQWIRSDYAASVSQIVDLLLILNSSALLRVAT